MKRIVSQGYEQLLFLLPWNDQDSQSYKLGSVWMEETETYCSRLDF